jgi:hypothetical protein
MILTDITLPSVRLTNRSIEPTDSAKLCRWKLRSRGTFPHLRVGSLGDIQGMLPTRTPSMALTFVGGALHSIPNSHHLSVVSHTSGLGMSVLL